MQGITFVDKGKAEWVRESLPECAADTVLLKTMYSGISNGTERNVLMGGNYGGTWPRRIGYQKVSEVVACGDRIDRFQVGDTVFTGTFTGHVEYHLARQNDLIIKLPKGIDLQEAALLGVASVPYHDAKSAKVQPGDRVLIFGGGLIGLFALQAARQQGAGHVTLVDGNPERLSLGLALGADEAINYRNETEYVRLSAGKPYHVVFECTGLVALDQIIGSRKSGSILAEYARVLLIGGRREVTYNFNDAAARQIAMISTRHFTQQDLEEVVELVAAGNIRIGSLVKHAVPVQDAISFYEALRDRPRDLLGVVFQWDCRED
jgi:2-desacetyl-2-hydroxyethyl bacteriochlorophyllide A dehydrogenase